MQGFVAIYGGSFDPLHKGHDEIINSLCKNPIYWHIIILPNFMNPLKSTPLFSAMERLQMCEIIAKKFNITYPPLTSLPRISVSDYEIKQNKAVFSIQSIRHIQIQMRSNYPKAQFAFVLGADNLANIAKWHKINDLCEMVKFVIIERENINFSSLTIQENVINCIHIADLKSTGETKHYIENTKLESKTANLQQNMRLDSHLLPTIQTTEHITLQHFGTLSSSKIRFLLQKGEIDIALQMIPASLHNMIKTSFRL